MKKVLIIIAVAGLSAASFAQGSLTPPGAPAATMKTLEQIEPRTDVATLPGSGIYHHMITQPGSYYLSGNIAVSMIGGIWINASDVTLDFNGFTIRGINSRSIGIDVVNGIENVLVRNGTIRDCPNFGIYAQYASRCTYRDLRFIGNDGTALAGGDRAMVEDCRIEGGGGVGLAAGAGSRITGNTIADNAGAGLQLTGAGSLVADNVVHGNGDNYDFTAGNQLNLLLCEIPETLDWPCSVKLAGSLSCSSNGVSGIVVTADDVAIDLCGHTLTGPGEGSGHGIYQGYGIRNLSVRNGKLANWAGTGSGGVTANGIYAVLSDLQASECYIGIKAGSSSIIKGCTAHDNSADGISGTTDTSIADCTASGNGDDGIHVGGRATLSRCTASGNTDDGFYAFLNSTFEGCTADGNTGDGIHVDSGASISRCIVSDNGANGINAEDDSTVVGCTARDNGNNGIHTANNGSISRCAAYGNGTGISVYSGGSIVGCTAKGNYTGIYGGTGSTVSRCAASENTTGINLGSGGGTISGCTANSNTGTGIHLFKDGTVEGCTAALNGGDGIYVSGDCHVYGNTCAKNTDAGIYANVVNNCIDRNNVTDNDTGITVIYTGGNIIVRNTARANTTNYDISPSNNDVGTIRTTPVGAGAWDNFSF